MTAVEACFLFLAALLGGGLNSVAGGGGLIVFPALLMAGLPPIDANATSTLASWPGAIASVGAYRQELQPVGRLCVLFGSISLVGGTIGSRLLLATPTATFEQLVPYLLLLATLLFAFSSSQTSRLPSILTQTGRDDWLCLLKASFIRHLQEPKFVSGRDFRRLFQLIPSAHL
jgi:hypothetical protein